MASPRSASPTAACGTRSPCARTKTDGARPSTTSSAPSRRLAKRGRPGSAGGRPLVRLTVPPHTGKPHWKGGRPLPPCGACLPIPTLRPTA
jgi:hypothetical protein